MSALRRIGRARFRCAEDGHAWRGRALLEDAMRTASFGDEGRLLLVRRLDLGRLSPGASATEWSRRCEEMFRRLRVDAVPADSPIAATADAVVFRDVAALWTALAVRAICGTPCVEWFWSAGARGWHPAMSRGETVRLCFAKLAECGGVAATVELAATILATGRMGELSELLDPQDVGRVLPPFASQVRAGQLPAPVGNDWLAVIAECAARRQPDDPRLRWFAVVAVLATYGEMSANIAVEAADVVVRHVIAPQSGTQAMSAGGTVPTRRSRDAARVEHADANAADADAPHDPLSGDATDAGRAGEYAAVAGNERAVDAASGARAERDLTPGVATRFGGLFFLVPLFAKLGIAEMPRGTGWLALRRVLDAVAGKLPDDVQEILPRPALDDLDPELRERTVAAGAALVRGARRISKKQTRLGLRALVQRPGRVAITRTHVDVFLRLADVDVRIRRAALDVDPGWVPWLGRAIHFHYTLGD